MPAAKGNLHVASKAEPPFVERDGNALGRSVVGKKFSGGVVGKSEVKTVAAYAAIQGSAGKVDIKRFVGAFGIKSGKFVFQRYGLMERDEAAFRVSFFPDSGTGEKKGISGTLGIEIDEGKHSDVLECEFR